MNLLTPPRPSRILSGPEFLPGGRRRWLMESAAGIVYWRDWPSEEGMQQGAILLWERVKHLPGPDEGDEAALVGAEVPA